MAMFHKVCSMVLLAGGFLPACFATDVGEDGNDAVTAGNVGDESSAPSETTATPLCIFGAEDSMFLPCSPYINTVSLTDDTPSSCGYYAGFNGNGQLIIDTNVDENAAWGGLLPTSSSGCSSAHTKLREYYQQVGGTYVSYGYTQLHGVWNGAACVWAYDSGYGSLPGLPSGTVTTKLLIGSQAYRVDLNGQQSYYPARAKMTYTINPC